MVEPMDPQSQPKLLIRILIGVAWLDGEIQPAERQYLVKVAQTYHLEQDADVAPLLNGSIKISTAQCEQLIQEYLGNRSIHDDDQLIEAISGLIYSDGDVAITEAKLLVDIQSTPSLTPQTQSPLISKIQHLYQNWLSKMG
jgi:uncharacterized tellurite resistance protein B-like protein